MAESKRIKNRVMITLCIVIAMMVTAIVVLAYNNEYLIKPGENADGIWKVEFTSIAEGEKIGSAVSRYKPSHTSTYASFYVDFVAPGDAIDYEIQIANLGTLDAQLTDILYIEAPDKDAIKYKIEGININDVLKSGATKNFTITVYYELDSNIALEFDKPISLSLHFEQANG